MDEGQFDHLSGAPKILTWNWLAAGIDLVAAQDCSLAINLL
jgi:hypothetical protein